MRAPSGFEEAFDDLFGTAFRVARRILGDPTTAEDVAAEATARAYAHWRKIGDQPWREGWVVRVATNLALDIARKRNRMTDGAIDGSGEPEGVDEGREADDVAVRLALVEAMARLPRRQREVVAMRHLAGMSEAETAAALQVSPGSVKTHLSRGLSSLRTRLGAELDIPTEEVTTDA